MSAEELGYCSICGAYWLCEHKTQRIEAFSKLRLPEWLDEPFKAQAKAENRPMMYSQSLADWVTDKA